jgi:hypothetical protein
MHQAGFRAVVALFDDLELVGGEGNDTEVKVTSN